MKTRQPGETLAIILALVFVVLAAVAGYRDQLVVKARVAEQTRVLEDFRRWRATYQSLLPIAKKWDISFPRAASVQDLYSLHGVIAKSLDTDMDRLMVTSLERVSKADAELLLTKACLSTNQAQGLVFGGAPLETLMAGIDALMKNPMVDMGKVTVRLENNFPVVVVQDFCIYIKD